MKRVSFSSIVAKATITHTVSYFIIGLISFALFDYSAKYADPVVARLMRQTGDPLVAAGTFFQLLRGALFGIVFYALRELVFPQKRGWLTMWLVLTIVGILSPFTAAPGSIEGALYTVLPAWFHIAGFPEVFVQAGVLSWVTHYWVNHPDRKWLNWALGMALGGVLLLAILGTLSALGMLPSAN
jgi:hypothetical protein